MAGTDTPWARLDQTFAFQGSDDDDVDEEGNYGGHGYAQEEEEEQSGRQSRKGSVMTITIGHEKQNTQQQYHLQHHHQRITTSNTHHRTATTSTTSTASTITPATAEHQRQISQLSTQQQQLHQQHRPRPSLDEQYATKPLPPVPQKGKLQKSTSNRSSTRPSNKPVHRSQPSTSSIASSVSSFNIPLADAAHGGAFTSSLTRIGSVSSPTTLLRPAQSSAGWFSSAAQNRTQPRQATSQPLIEPPSLTPLDLPPLASPPPQELLSPTSNQNVRPITPLAQPPLMAPLDLPPLTRSRGGGSINSGGSNYPSHLPAAPPRSAPHGDTVSLFSVRSMNSVATSTGASGSNNRIRDDSSSMYSERHVPTSTAKHSPSLPSLSSFSSSSARLKPAAAVPGKAVRKFMRMAGKAASSAKDAMKGPLHSHSNDSTPSIGGHSSGGTPSITVTTPMMSPMLSPAPSSRPPQPPSIETTLPVARPTMVARRRSMSKIRQLTGLDVGAVTGGGGSVGVPPVNNLRRSQSTDTATRGHMPASSTSSASNVPRSSVSSAASTTATTPSIWNTSMFNSDDENDEDENEDTYAAEDRTSGDEGSVTVKSKSPSPTPEDIAADTPDPAMASLLRSLSQTSTQPPPAMSRLQLGQQTSSVEHQRTLLPPNRLLKIKRFSDPTMAPIIEHPDDTSNPSGSNSSRSSHYSERETGPNVVPDNDNDEDASAFIPRRPAPVPVRSPSPPPAVSPTQPSMLSLTLFPPVPSISTASIAKHIPTIRLFPSSSDNQPSATSPTSPATAASSPTAHSPIAPVTRKNTLPTSNDISNPWPTSPPPRPPPPPPLHPLTTPETDVSESISEVAEKRLSGTSPNAAMFRTVQWGQMADPVRSTTSSSASTANRLSLHARTKSNGSASESIATSIATSVANSSTSGSSALSSTVASTIASSSRSAGFGSFSSVSTASNRHSYQMATPPMPPPPPPNYPLPPLPTSSLIPVPMSMSMSMSMPVSMTTPPPATQSAFDEDDEEVSARMMAARMMKKAASRDSVRWRPTALGKSLFRREGSPGPSGSSETKSTGTPGLRSSLSTRSSLSATTLLAAQRVAQATRKTVEAVSEGGSSSSSSAARQHELEMEKWREDLRSRIRMIPEGGEVTKEEALAPAAPQLSPVPMAQQPKMAAQAAIHEIRTSPVHETEHGGMI